MNEKIICTCDQNGLMWASLEDLNRIMDVEITACDEDVDFYGWKWLEMRSAQK